MQQDLGIKADLTLQRPPAQSAQVPTNQMLPAVQHGRHDMTLLLLQTGCSSTCF